MQITNETKVTSVVLLGGSMISITSTVEELIKEVVFWDIKYWSSTIYENELRLYNYENYKEKCRIRNSDVVIVVKLISAYVEGERLYEFYNRLVEFIGKSTGRKVVK